MTAGTPGYLLPQHMSPWQLTVPHPSHRASFLPRWHTQGGKDMPKFSTHNCAIALLVKDTQPLYKVLVRALLLVAGDVLQDGQERLKVQHLGIHLFQQAWKDKESNVSGYSGEHRAKHPSLAGSRA